LKSSNEVANSFLESEGGTLLIGSAFSKHGEGYLRLSNANSAENIERVLERMGAVL
jgi:aspartate aminotransferase